MAERIRLSEHFTYKKLFRFVLPSVIMMVFTSIYGIVDGFFVSNYTDGLPFAALNLIYPFVMILGSVGFMLGTGGNAVVAKLLGEGKSEQAKRTFSMLIYTTIVFGIILSLLGILFVRPIAELFASTEKGLSPAEKAQLIEYCIVYARIILIALPAFMLQNAFQGFFVTAEKPRLGLYVTVVAGCVNIVLDALFVAVFRWGLVGAAVATAISQCMGGILPLFYFSFKNDSLLKLCKTTFDGKTLVKVCINGMSELMTNVSISVVTILYNAQLMKYIGINGVSAYGIMMYVSFIFVGIFLGYSIGSAPIIGYHYGADNKDELKSIFRKSLRITTVAGIIMTLVAFVFAKPLALIFVQEETLLNLTVHGLRLYALSFLVCGFNIFGSAFFTALSNGGISLLLSFFRLFLCQMLAIVLLPLWLDQDGIWLAALASELVSFVLTIVIWLWEKDKYGYA